MEKLLPDINAVIGKTAMVDLARLVRASGLEGRIYAKLEYLNPGFSKKDRAALSIIEEAERNGDLAPGRAVLELTSGNMGIGLAVVCAVKGYRFIAVISKGNSPERARMMRALGAEVVLVDQEVGSTVGKVSGADLAKAEVEAARIAEELNAFRADQFHREGNSRAHAEGTAAEMWWQTDGSIDAYVDFSGSGGTFAGCAKALKKYNPAIRCYVVEPATAAYLAQGDNSAPNHRIQGGGYSMDLPLIDPGTIDGFLTVTDEEAMRAARDLAKLEGIFAGFSSGANVAAALNLLRGPEKGSRIALTINDCGLKYMSTDLFDA